MFQRPCNPMLEVPLDVTICPGVGCLRIFCALSNKELLFEGLLPITLAQHWVCSGPCGMVTIHGLKWAFLNEVLPSRQMEASYVSGPPPTIT